MKAILIVLAATIAGGVIGFIVTIESTRQWQISHRDERFETRPASSRQGGEWGALQQSSEMCGEQSRTQTSVKTTRSWRVESAPQLA